MRFLREERGELLVTPSRAAVPPAAVPGMVPPVPAKIERPAPNTAVRRAVTPHCRFFCRWCGSVILLPHERIGLPFGAPYLRRIEVRAVATACDSCGHVSNFSLFRGSPGFDTRHGLVPAEPRGEVVLVDWLQCREETCSYPLPLFAEAHGPLTAEAVPEMAARWNWDELTCAMGHRILAPLWIFGREPYQLPAPIR